MLLEGTAVQVFSLAATTVQLSPRTVPVASSNADTDTEPTAEKIALPRAPTEQTAEMLAEPEATNPPAAETVA